MIFIIQQTYRDVKGVEKFATETPDRISVTLHHCIIPFRIFRIEAFSDVPAC
jgi:hypothetical protein